MAIQAMSKKILTEVEDMLFKGMTEKDVRKDLCKKYDIDTQLAKRYLRIAKASVLTDEYNTHTSIYDVKSIQFRFWHKARHG